MTECSKPLDLVKNKIFFFGAADAAKPDARIRARTNNEIGSFFNMAHQHNTRFRCEKRIMPPFASRRVSSRIAARAVAAEVTRRKCFSRQNQPPYVGGYHS